LTLFSEVKTGTAATGTEGRLSKAKGFRFERGGTKRLARSRRGKFGRKGGEHCQTFHKRAPSQSQLSWGESIPPERRQEENSGGSQARKGEVI